MPRLGKTTGIGLLVFVVIERCSSCSGKRCSVTGLTISQIGLSEQTEEQTIQPLTMIVRCCPLP
jgi:hypothetical protein